MPVSIRCLTVPLTFFLIALAGCAIVDPHNILTRQRTESPIPETPVPVKNDNWRREALDFVWNTINERYYDPKLNGVDWQAARARHEKGILDAATDDEFWERLDKMAGELRDSHTRVHSPKQVAQQRNNESHGLGIGFLELDGHLVLTSVHPQSDAYWAGARAGMTIRTIDGKDALSYYRMLVAESRDTSTPWARTRGAQRKIVSGDIDSTLAMTFARSDGSEIAATLKRRRIATPPEYSARVLPSGFGYVRWSGFVGTLERGIVAEIDKMKDTPGMILDLRGNGGGSGQMSANLLARFFKDDTKGVRMLTRSGKPIRVFFIDVMKLEPELKGLKEKAYVKPVVVLTNEGSASASEVFAAVMKETGRAVLVGQRTCGCLLGYMGYADVPGGGWLAYSELGFVTPSGKRVEGSGIDPDVEVKLTRDDYLLYRDRALEAAERVLREKAGTGKQ